jgi:hypothetical protein
MQEAVLETQVIESENYAQTENVVRHVEEKEKVLVVDIGRSYTKVFGSGRKSKFQSCYSYPKNSFGFDAGLGYSEKSVLEFEGEKYLVGDDAVNTRDASFLTDTDSIIQYAPLFLAKALDGRRHECTTLCLGLPLADYKDKKDALKSRCRRYKINGKEYHFEKVNVYAQGTGPLFEHLHRHPKDRNICIIEIGFFTVDIILFENGQVVDSDFRDDRGINELCKKIHAWGYNKFGVDVSLAKLQRIVQERSLECVSSRYSKHDTELRTALKQLTERFTHDIVQHIKQRFGQSLKTLDRIVFAGGGANYLIEEHLPVDMVSDKLIYIVKEPEFSNARGWYLKATAGKRQ